MFNVKQATKQKGIRHVKNVHHKSQIYPFRQTQPYLQQLQKTRPVFKNGSGFNTNLTKVFTQSRGRWPSVEVARSTAGQTCTAGVSVSTTDVCVETWTTFDCCWIIPSLNRPLKSRFQSSQFDDERAFENCATAHMYMKLYMQGIWTLHTSAWGQRPCNQLVDQEWTTSSILFCPSQGIKFPSVPQHCSLDDSKAIRPVKNWFQLSQTFSFGLLS